MLKNIMTVTLEGAIAIVYFATDGDTAGAVPIPTVTDTYYFMIMIIMIIIINRLRMQIVHSIGNCDVPACAILSCSDGG